MTKLQLLTNARNEAIAMGQKNGQEFYKGLKELEQNGTKGISRILEDLTIVDDSGFMSREVKKSLKKLGLKGDFQSEIQEIKKSYTESASPSTTSTCIGNILMSNLCENRLMNLATLEEVPYCVGTTYKGDVYTTATGVNGLIAEGAIASPTATTLTSFAVIPERRAGAKSLTVSQLSSCNTCVDAVLYANKALTEEQVNTIDLATFAEIASKTTIVNTTAIADYHLKIEALAEKVTTNFGGAIEVYTTPQVFQKLVNSKDNNGRNIIEQAPICGLSCRSICYSNVTIYESISPALKSGTTHYIVAGKKTAMITVHSPLGDIQLTDGDRNTTNNVRLETNFHADTIIPTALISNFAYTSVVIA